jgi:CO dehydrogenase maturation factor
MKIAITGKGGTGKTTIAGILAHYLKNDGYKVLAVDADPDANLASAIGIPSEQANLIIPISLQKELIQERTGAKPSQFGQLFKINPNVEDIPEKFIIDHSGIKLLVMGAVQAGGEGCACPENILLRNLLSEVFLRQDEVIIVDMEAGIEHLGRATARDIDYMLIVVEPGRRSIATSRSIMKLAEEIGVQRFGIIGNKISSEKQRRWIQAQVPKELFIGMISHHDIIQEADRELRPLMDDLNQEIKDEFNIIYSKINKILLQQSSNT